MIDFKDYLVREYIRNINGYTAVEFKFSYSLKTSSNSVIGSITFENNTLTKSSLNKFKNISAKEHINKFNKAKSEIIATIINEHQQKVKELTNIITNLQNYRGGLSNVIPNQYQGECIQLNEPVINEPIKKQSFEM